MKLLRLILLLICLGFVGSISAQEVDPKLAEAFQRVLDSMHQVLNIKGLAGSVQLPNDAVWAGGSGVSTTTPLDSIWLDHSFVIGSATKTITGACILQMADEGILSLDDSLHLWLPDYQNVNPNITIRQLMRHQSGVAEVFQYPGFQQQLLLNPSQLWPLEEVVETFVLPPDFPPGTSWKYSNTNYILLGMIIEAASGQSYHAEIEERFFDPLGLTSFVQPAYDLYQPPIAHLWLDLDGNGSLDDAHNFFTGWLSLFSAVGPAGGYFARPYDMARWMRIAMNGSLYSPEIWLEAQETVNTPGGTAYGLALSERYFQGYRGLGHGGDVSYSTQVFYFPEKDVSISVQANDASIVSWDLTPVVEGLLLTFLECEEVVSAGTPLVMNLRAGPNPFSDRIVLKGEQAYDLELVDSFGRQVASGRSGEGFEGLGPLPAGVYFLRAFSDGEMVAVKKMVK